MTEPAIGYYGKFPSNGDFVSRNLPSTFIQKWDRWLQDAMEDARLTLGDEWIDAYLTGPIWRFALSSGICGDVSWMGLMIPNVDKVGRHFPLTIAAQVPDSESLLYAFANNDEWFEIVESLSLYTLDQGFNRDRFDSDIDELSPPTPSTYPVKGGITSSHDSSVHFNVQSTRDIYAALSAWVQSLIRPRIPPFSLWWSAGSELVHPSLLICSDLPTPKQFAAMLDGNWSAHQWSSINICPKAASICHPN